MHLTMSNGSHDKNYNVVNHHHHHHRRKLKILVITMGGERQKYIKEMFNEPIMKLHFETPTFSSGISSRLLRNRYQFFHYANEAGLLPKIEWDAIYDAYNSSEEQRQFYEQNPEKLFDCFNSVPLPDVQYRRGNEYEKQMHYSVELWKKGKTINRGRAVFACTLAHLIALKKLVDENYDLLLEDNVRIPIEECATRIWETLDAITEWENTTTPATKPEEINQQQNEQKNEQQQQPQNDPEQQLPINNSRKCHLRYMGWLGSIPNIKWIYNSHIKRKRFQRKCNAGNNGNQITVVEIPTTQDIEADLNQIHLDDLSLNNNTSINDNEKNLEQQDCINGTKVLQETKQSEHTNDFNAEIDTNNMNNNGDNNIDDTMERKPGGNPVWGTYAYWLSKDAYECIMNTLRNDVGSMLWKSKRMRNYIVKPIDKIVPRNIIANFGQQCIQLSTHPTFFRAPMLSSNIHTQWDSEFCKSTEIQLYLAGKLRWHNLWLSSDERNVVQYHRQTDNWITTKELKNDPQLLSLIYGNPSSQEGTTKIEEAEK